MKVLGVIPARKGSKGVKGKNTRVLNGLPLITHTIRSAIKSKIFADIIVTSDSDETIKIAISEGVLAPFKREPYLSDDTALAIPVIQDAVKRLMALNKKKYDYICMLQPTTPLRSLADYKNIYRLIKDGAYDSVISVVEVSQHPYKMVREDTKGMLSPFLDWPEENPPRQKLPKIYTYNGAFYLTRFEILMNSNTFKGKSCKLYKMPISRSINIDNEMDFLLADIMLTKFKNNIEK